MKLQTKIPVTPEQDQIDYDSKVLLMGSCFTENIGGKLEYFKFQNLQNPFGVIFHPLAIENLVTRAINDDLFNEDNIFYHEEQWHCLEVHSLISASEKELYLELLNHNLKQLKSYLLCASHIVFTYGTAWVYRNNETDTIVANCHKLPKQQFSKELLSAATIETCISNVVSAIHKVNPKATCIATVSPVRHLKDGFAENTRSKAHLLVGLPRTIGKHAFLYYFPSYELMMDEMRDYRFYTKDLLHPNETAISIIWDRFQKAWVASGTELLQKEIASIRSGLDHKPFHPSSETHQKFQKALQLKIREVQKKLPHITF